MLARTLDRAAALHLSVRTLETLADVDTAEDVVREWARLRPLLGAPLGRAVASALDLAEG